jgi:hypothetical protein
MELPMFSPMMLISHPVLMRLEGERKIIPETLLLFNTFIRMLTETAQDVKTLKMTGYFSG